MKQTRNYKLLSQTNDLNLTSMLDVIFILFIFALVFFQIEKSITSLKVNLPKSKITNVFGNETVVRIEVKSLNEIYWNQELYSFEKLSKQMQANACASQKIQLGFASNLEYASVFQFLELVQTCSPKELELIAQKK